MFLENLVNQTSAPLLERLLNFTAARHKLLAENLANMDTPDYQQKDLSTDKFMAMLRDRVEQRDAAAPGSVGFDDIDQELDRPNNGILSHDGNNRSMEQLVSDQAKNALLHNVVIELLRQQYQEMEMALKERVS
jgi:flagellar basal-body rod protein FlgB